ncbi:hypothetical protein TU84_22795 [Pseudomonas helleri]|nr:hypothetical protein TU84_22795 [Pseudomonas helleri]
MEATWNGALFSAATIRLPVSTQSSRRAFGKAVVQRGSERTAQLFAQVRSTVGLDIYGLPCM